ncbi:MAG: DUF1800 domain-containing protein [bacterium]
MANRETPTSLNLNPYTGEWGYTQVAHLLRRTMFGATVADIAKIQAKSMSDAVDLLLADQPAPPDAPLVWYHIEIGGVVDGQTWVNLDYNSVNDFNRSQSLVGWYVQLLLTQNISIREKMTLFWHNHFSCGITAVSDARYMYIHNGLIRSNALGNFKTLVKSVTLDPAMLRYLSGNKNVATAPNENFARELQELFTIGKGSEVSAGDYTTYTEADVKAAAHVLTGWKDDRDTITAVFNASQHDPGDKQFSVRYANTVIKGSTDQTGAERELDDLITMIFNQNETARYVCRKLFSWFVDYKIDDAIEQNVIGVMAQTLIFNNFEIKPVLSQLLKSSLFYDAAYRGCMIKTPIDLVIGSVRTLGIAMPSPDKITTQYYGFISLRETAGHMQMSLLEPPNVAGWPEYYEAPQYHELWLNSGTLGARVTFLDDIATDKFQLVVQDYEKTSFDPTQLIKQLSDPTDPKKIIADLAKLLYPNPLADDQMTSLHEQLLSGLPDYEWTSEWTTFLADPLNPTKKAAVKTKLVTLIKYMLELAEYQLM